jgi:hypothetical protein
MPNVDVRIAVGRRNALAGECAVGKRARRRADLYGGGIGSRVNALVTSA